MRERIVGLTDTIRQVLGEAFPSDVSLKEIYAKVRYRLDITPEQEEITYGQPNYQHSVRRILTELVRSGQVARTGRGMYQKI